MLVAAGGAAAEVQMKPAHAAWLSLLVAVGLSGLAVVPWVDRPGMAMATSQVRIVASASQLDDYCSPLMAKAPLALHDLHLERRVSGSPGELVWGEGAGILACGVARPSELRAASSARVLRINDVDFVTRPGRRFVDYIAIDRALYVLIRVSRTLDSAPVPQLATLIGQSMARVCQTQGYGEVYPTDQLCSRRR